MDKIIHLEERFPHTGEPTVQPVMLWSGGRPFIESITKTASVGSEYFKTITPIPGHSIVYLLAVSSWEIYGENRNGDGFPEHPYKENERPPWIAPEDVLTLHYKTFEEYGHNFRHHVNKDPKKAVGKVMRAFWNGPMHRVELLVDLDDAKAPDLAERIASGEFPPVSMGTRVPYDVCNYCGNRAPTRAQYCDHLRYQMREVINGIKVAALNPKPKFFDISWVFRPADETAYMMKKVAYAAPYELLSGVKAGEYLEEMNERKLAAHKMAVIDKVVEGLPVDAKTEGVDPTELDNLKRVRTIVIIAGNNTPDLSDSMISQLSEHPLKKIFSTLFASGVLLNTPEVMRIFAKKCMPSASLTPRMLDNGVGLKRSVLEFYKDCPQMLDHFDKSGMFNMGPEAVDTKIAEAIEPLLEKRSGIGEYLKRRFVPERYRDEIPYSTPLTIADPASGHRYMTTRGAAIRAHDEIAKRNLYKVLGGGALLAGAYGLISSGLRSRGLGVLKPLVAGTLGYLGYKHWPTMGQHYMTEQGVPIPTLTELRKYSAFNPRSLALPLFGTLGLMTLMAHDYKTRQEQGIPTGHPFLPTSRRLLDKVEELAYEHPLITAGLGTGLLWRGGGGLRRGLKALPGLARQAKSRAQAAYEGLRSGTTKMSEWLGDDVPQATDTVMLPEIDIDKVAMRIGEVIANA